MDDCVAFSQESSKTSAITNVLDQLLTKSKYPLSCTIELTQRCNLNCPHCYIPKRGNQEELTTKEIIGFLDQLVESGTIFLTLTGGEPALRDDLIDVIEHAQQRHFSTTLQSNGTLFSERDVSDLFGAGLRILKASLYHHDPDVHDKFVGKKGSWRRVVEILSHFHSLGGRVIVATTIMNWNVQGILQLERFCIENGWFNLLTPNLEPRFDGDTTPLSFEVEEEDFERVVLESQYYKKRLYEPLKKVDPGNRVCSAGVASVCLKSNGDITPCIGLPLELGNIRECAYQDMFSNSSVLRYIQSARWCNTPKCANCECLPLCGYCIGTSYLLYNDLHRPAPIYCKISKSVMRARVKGEKINKSK